MQGTPTGGAFFLALREHGVLTEAWVTTSRQRCRVAFVLVARLGVLDQSGFLEPVLERGV